MSREQNEEPPAIINPLHLQEKEEDKDLYLGSDEPEAPLPLTVTSRVLYMLGDIAAGPAYRFAQWLDLVRKRSARYGSSGFPHRPHRADSMESSAAASFVDSKCISHNGQSTEISLWERLGNAAILDIESSSFSWDMLSSVHHNEHSSSNEQSEDDPNKALEEVTKESFLKLRNFILQPILDFQQFRIQTEEVTVNSGGVVFFALFNHFGNDDSSPKEAAAVIKFSSSRMATQSERLGYEFANWLRVQTPQARVIHNSSPEWLQIKEATEKARSAAKLEGDDVGEMTCSELLEALELSRCLMLMSYVHGCPLLESTNAFESQERAERVALALGRVLVLDLIIRNEDRLPCRTLRWRGNSANLLLAEKMACADSESLEDVFDSAIKRYQPRVLRTIQKERRSTSVDSRLSSHNQALVSQASDLSDITESPKSSDTGLISPSSDKLVFSNFNIVAIDSGVPRRPPAGKRTNDQEIYPKLIELLLNSSEYTANLLHELTGGKLGAPLVENGEKTNQQAAGLGPIIREFRRGFRLALRDLQGSHIFLITLHQKLDGLVRAFLTVMDKTMSGDMDKEEYPSHELGSPASGYDCGPCSSPKSKERFHHYDYSDADFPRFTLRTPKSESKENSDSSSPMSRESWTGKSSKSSGDPLHNLRLTSKFRDFHKFAKVDVETYKELEQWNEMLKNEVVKICQENNFNTGFFEGCQSNYCVDAYELKIRLEHILERIQLISKAANTEKPSAVSDSLFIGGALAARSVFTLQHLGITHILCLCSNEIGQSDSQNHELFEYKNFALTDEEDTNIDSIFEEAFNFIDHAEQIGGKVLVHCFEGRSRSATLVLACLMVRKNLTLLEAWNTLKRVHRRAQPNDGFARVLQELDRELHGKVSMEWRQRKPTMKVCPVCGIHAGLSSSSLKLHLQKSHKKLSSGSVDSAMTMEIQKALEALKLSNSRSSSASPRSRQPHSGADSPA